MTKIEVVIGSTLEHILSIPIKQSPVHHFVYYF